MYCVRKLVIVVRAVVLGDHHSRPGAETGKEADDQIGDDGGTAAHRRQGRRAETAPDHDGIHSVV